MNYEYPLYCTMLIVVVFLALRLFFRTIDESVIYVPKQIAVNEMDLYEAQDVYNWVAYVTRLTGRRYLEQLAFPNGCRHSLLLCDLTTALHTETEEEMLEQLTAVGRDHRLCTKIIDQPI